MAKCFTCGKPIVGGGDIPKVCSKECKTKEFNNALSEYRLRTRGFPSGYHSVEEYQRSLEKSRTFEKICVVCGDTFVGGAKRECCSTQCTDALRVKRIQQTKFAKYGSKSYNNRDKSKITCLEKYGVENVTQCEDVKKKSVATSIERYGVDNPSKSDEIKQRIVDSFQERFGVDNVFQRRDIIEPAMIKKYGAANPQQVKEINERTRNTVKEKYEDLSGAVPRAASEKTCLERYGAKTFFASEAGRMSNENLMNRYNFSPDEVIEHRQRQATCTMEYYIKKYGDIDVAKAAYEERLRTCDSSSYEWALKQANGDSSLADQIYMNRQIVRVNEPGVASASSLKLFVPVEEYLINQHGISKDDIYVGDKTRKEYFLWDHELKRIYFYDFTILSKKIIVEFNGTMYHPKAKEDNEKQWNKDQRKKYIAESEGFRYIVVWDDISKTKNYVALIERIEKCLTM